ncbi:MAG: hypothetical protein ABS55_01760 [Lautropia sp. SCN 70-15]|nr:MAG: hypothetical protein ABS55_01760 [Lautropia sp. SCN 70-15]
MTLDPDFKYFLVGKETAQILTHAQAESLEGMVSVFTCDDFSGYSGPPGWSIPTHWQLPVSAYPGPTLPNFNAAWMFGESGAHENDLAQLEVITKYTTPSGAWADISETSGGPANNTGLFLVGVKGPAAASMIAESYGDFTDFIGPTDLSVGYAYSNTDGGQRIYVTAFGSPFFEALVQQVHVYAAYDAPPPAAAFWTDFIGSREVR